MNCPFCKSHLISEGHFTYITWYCRNCTTGFYLPFHEEAYYTIIIEDPCEAYFDCYSQKNYSLITIPKLSISDMYSSKIFTPIEAKAKLKTIIVFS